MKFKISVYNKIYRLMVFKDLEGKAPFLTPYPNPNICKIIPPYICTGKNLLLNVKCNVLLKESEDLQLFIDAALYTLNPLQSKCQSKISWVYLVPRVVE